MKTKEFIKLRESVEKCMDDKRFEHTLGVSYTAAAMAMKHGVDVEKARIAGLLHDVAKCMDDKKKIEICDKNKLPIDDFERENPFLLHGKVGAFLAKDKYDVEDEDILSAISYHTTGRPGMSDLEKIIYIADFIEPNRKPLDILEESRRLAFTNLDECLIFILKHILQYLNKEGKSIDPMSEAAYHFYVEQHNSL